MLIGVGAQGAPRDLVQAIEIAKTIKRNVRIKISHMLSKPKYFITRPQGIEATLTGKRNHDRMDISHPVSIYV
jgi:hypothetical protein